MPEGKEIRWLTWLKNRWLKEKNKELKDHYELKDTGFDYTPEDQELTCKIPEICRYTPQGVAKTQDGCYFLPTRKGQQYVASLHRLTHLGKRSSKKLLRAQTTML